MADEHAAVSAPANGVARDDRNAAFRAARA